MPVIRCRTCLASGAGNTGPWIGADLEQGMYYGGGNMTQQNPGSPAMPFPFVTACKYQACDRL